MPINKVPEKDDVNIGSIEISKIIAEIKVSENIQIIDVPNADIPKNENDIKISGIEIPKISLILKYQKLKKMVVITKT